ncbi:hypothetical protein AAMO2058_001154900 [Amorphochlora amoebiformis]
MNSDILKAAEGIVSSAYISQGASSRRSREKLIHSLLTQRCLPRKPWDDRTIALFMAEIASMDSNNFPDNAGVGEREGRVFSRLVAGRHHGLAHGIGRSGDVGAIQPKAAGSSLLMRLATAMALHTIKISGVPAAQACLLLPVATGMAHLLTFCCLRMRHRKQEPKEGGPTRSSMPRYVVWPRIDQKTCLKSIVSAGFEPIVVENIRDNDLLRTDTKAIEAAIQKVGPENVLCVLTTASCFAPRAPDKLEEVAEICKKLSVAHVINNAYGLQSPKVMGRIDRAARKGRVDVFIQSTDKNLMVPVGGSIVAGFDKKLIDDISKTYPGRASMAPVMDVFLTLVGMGEEGWKSLIAQRKENMKYFQTKLGEMAKKHGERILNTKPNPISLAITVDTLILDQKRGASYVGSMLFRRCVSGPRVVACGTKKSVCGIEFLGYGSHCNEYPHNYLVMACAIGMTKGNIDLFLQRLEKVIKEIRKEQKKTTRAVERKVVTKDSKSS